MDRSIEAKVVILGSQGVGKTSIALRFIGQKFNRLMTPTIGASYFSHKILCDKHLVKLEIWDTAGQERFKAMAPMYYRNAKAAVIVYDITCYDSFLSSHSWIRELQRIIHEPIILCIVGNKCDLQSERKVPLKEAVNFAITVNAKYFETSALNNEGIDDVFLSIAKRFIDNGNNGNNDSHNSPSQSVGNGKVEVPNDENNQIVRKECCYR